MKSSWWRYQLSLTFLFTAFYLPQVLHAQEIRVTEIRTHIHELPVTGYQLLLNQPPAEISRFIREYLAPYPVEPFVFENTLVYEQFEYAPVTDAQPITLYYLTEPEQQAFTRLTVVALYGYQHSISAHQYPDMALRLLLDLAEMVRTFNGEEINFDPIFENTDATLLEERFVQRRESRFSSYYLAQQTERIGDSEELLMRKNPFEVPKPEDFATDEQVMNQLAMRFHTYIERKKSAESSPFLANEETNLIHLYRDSVEKINRELNSYRQNLAFAKTRETQAIIDGSQHQLITDSLRSRLLLTEAMNRELSRKNQRLQYEWKQVSEYAPYSDSTDSEIERLQEEVRRLKSELQKQEETLAAKNRELNVQLKLSRQEAQDLLNQLLESQTLVRNLESDQELSRLRAEKKALEIELKRRENASGKADTDLRQELESIRQESNNLLEQLLEAQMKYMQVHTRVSELESDLNKNKQRISRLQQEKRGINQQLVKTKNELDAAKIQLSGVKRPVTIVDNKELADLQRENQRNKYLADSLRQLVEILNPESEKGQDRLNLYRQQLESLFGSQQELMQKELEIAKREKQIAQREKFLSSQQKEIDRKELLVRIHELETQVLDLESRQTGAALLIKPGKHRESGKEIPVWVCNSLLSDNELAFRIHSHFLSKNIRPSAGSELRFVAVFEPKISEKLLIFDFFQRQDPLGMQVVDCAIRISGGGYLVPETGSITDQEVRRYLESILSQKD